MHSSESSSAACVWWCALHDHYFVRVHTRHLRLAVSLAEFDRAIKEIFGDDKADRVHRAKPAIARAFHVRLAGERSNARCALRASWFSLGSQACTLTLSPRPR